MKKEKTGEITLEKVNGTLDEFRGTFSEIKGTLDEFRGTFGEIKVTLSELTEMLGFVVQRMVTKEELTQGLASLRGELKGDLFALQTQVNGIETDIHEMKHARLELRVADLEEKVFGKAR